MEILIDVYYGTNFTILVKLIQIKIEITDENNLIYGKGSGRLEKNLQCFSYVETNFVGCKLFL